MLNSLQHMLNGGIYDHLGGGLSRYSTDASWLIPHFEKMLYDNAQLIRFCNWAYAETGDICFRSESKKLSLGCYEKCVSSEAFASSIDADSEGEEGRFYTWSRKEVEQVLGEDASSFLEGYSLSAPDHWEGDPVLHRTWQRQRTMSRPWNSMREKLLAARCKRARPGRDDKVLVDWNGLAIEAIAEAGRLSGRTDWIEAAAAAFRFVMESNDADGRLPHSILGPRRSFPGLASDHAAMCNAAVSLFEATGEQDLLQVSDHLSAHTGQMVSR